MKNQQDIGEEMYQWAKDLFPVNRSLTGEGVRETLNYLKVILPELEVKSVPSGYKAFDWEVPKEWNVSEAYIETEEGERIVDFATNNLHLVGYSIPVDKWISLEDLQKHIYSLPEQPDAIPYVTSYYKERWGFCLTENQRQSLSEEKYHVVVKSKLEPGILNYGELLIPGELEEEVLLSTYVCHPSMANNELSGPVVTTALARWISQLKNKKYSYRILFVPETIGSIVYLSKNLGDLKKKVVAGFNITCIGDDRCYSYVPSREGNTISDEVALHVLQHTDPSFKQYSWLDRGSDERQYCSPGVDLPIATITRSKYGEYPEYHTSLDDLDLISAEGLAGGFKVLKRAIEIIEHNHTYQTAVLCEPQLGKRGLYPTISSKGSAAEVRAMTHLISYCDATRSLLKIADIIKIPFWELLPIAMKLKQHEVIKQL